MYRKFIFIFLATILLSGCTLFPTQENAAININTDAPFPTSSSVVIESDHNYESTQTTSLGSDIESLEKDLDVTLIPDEDLSDIIK